MVILYIIVIVILMTLMIFLKTYVSWGLKVTMAGIKYKQSLAFLMLRTKNNNLMLPIPIDDRLDTATVTINKVKHIFPLQRSGDKTKNMFFLGKALYIRDIEDAQHELGFFYENEDGTHTVLKSPNYTPSNLLQTIINDAILNDGIFNLLKTVKILLYIGLALLIVNVFGTYVSWEVLQWINTGGIV